MKTIKLLENRLKQIEDLIKIFNKENGSKLYLHKTDDKMIPQLRDNNFIGNIHIVDGKFAVSDIDDYKEVYRKLFKNIENIISKTVTVYLKVVSYINDNIYSAILDINNLEKFKVSELIDISKKNTKGIITVKNKKISIHSLEDVTDFFKPAIVVISEDFKKINKIIDKINEL
jgi:hypothetical protein